MISQTREQAVAVDIPGLWWSVGAPQPLLIATEQRTLFAFMLDPEPANGDGLYQTAEFIDCDIVRFGFPNDEALPGHPLWDAGLDGYTAYEIVGSRWLAELRAIEASHDDAPAVPFKDQRHFTLAFHDSLLEAIARDIAIGDRFDTLTDAATYMLEQLTDDQ